MASSCFIDEYPSRSRGPAELTDAFYRVSDVPLGTRRPLRVLTIGAGASGLNLAQHVEMHMDNIEHVIYEKNADVGGTWFENRYANHLKRCILADLIKDTLVVHVIFPVTTTSSRGKLIQNGPDCESSKIRRVA